MKSQHVFVILLFITLSLSCINSEDSIPVEITSFSYDSFLRNQELSGQMLQLEGLRDPHRIKIIDSLLLIIDLAGDKFISVYNLNDYSFEGSFLSKGRGPSELTTAWNIDYSSAMDCLYFSDPNVRKVLFYTLAHVVNVQNEVVTSSAVIDLDESVDNVKILSTKEILSTSLDMGSKERFVLMDSLGKRIGSKIKYPNFSAMKDDYGLSGIFDSEFVVKTDESKIAVFNRYTDLMEIYEMNGTLIKMHQGPDGFLPSYIVNRTDHISFVSRIDGKTRRSYYQPIEKDDMLWVLYSGQFIESNSSYNKIFVFDWNGDPVAIYNMPHNLYSFDVDTEKRIIYGLAETRESYALFAYPF